MKGDMDLSVLPNNNHPDKFLQLDVKSLMRSSALLQASLARFPGGNYPAAQRWQNLVYSQRKFSKPFLSEPEQYCRIYKIKHGCSQTGQHPPEHCQFHSAQIHISHIFREKREKKTVAARRVERSSVKHPVAADSPPPSLSSVLKNNPLYGGVSLEGARQERRKNPSWTVEDYDKHSLHTNLSGLLKENPNDLRFWLGEMYTPGFDTLLKKEEKQEKLWKSCRLGLLLLLVACILVSILTVSTIFT